MTNLTYNQTTGHLTNDDGVLVAEGWAGKGEGRNNHAMQEVSCVGPLPCGKYAVQPWEAMHPGLGPLVARLIQIEGDNFHRDGFFIHGPSKGENYGEESKGCIIIPRPMRNYVNSLNPQTITVISGVDEVTPDELG